MERSTRASRAAIPSMSARAHPGRGVDLIGRTIRALGPTSNTIASRTKQSFLRRRETSVDVVTVNRDVHGGSLAHSPRWRCDTFALAAIPLRQTSTRAPPHTGKANGVQRTRRIRRACVCPSSREVMIRPRMGGSARASRTAISSISARAHLGPRIT